MKVLPLYNYCLEVVRRAQQQGKPEWALNDKEKRALRHLTAINKNFIVEEEGKPHGLEH